MPLGSLPISNLYTGVSLQPLTLKLASSADAVTNGWLSVVTGASKRPASQHVAALNITMGDPADGPDSVYGYLIDRGPDYSFIVSINRGNLKVFDLQGNEQTVSFPNGKSYINQSITPVTDWRGVTIGDTTFFANRRVTTISDEYGEVGYDSIAGAITVANYAALPSSPTVGVIYFTSDTGTYYRYTHHDTTPAVYGWVKSGVATHVQGAPETTALSANPVAGQSVYLRYRVAGVNNPYWQLYIAQITTPAGGAFNSWDVVTPLDIGIPPAGVTRFDPQTRGTVYVVQSIANVNYSIYINNVLKATYLTPKGVDATTSVPGTDAIASSLVSALVASGITAVELHGSTIAFTNLLPTDKLVTVTSNGDKALKSYKENISSFDELPPSEAENRIVKVQGDLKNNGDDYYVIYQNKEWIETVGFGQASQPKQNSMPHKLVREADGTWTFSEHTWASRAAGSMDSNPNPSFIGFPLNDIFIYSNRMCFVADTNIIMSEANTYENFFRTTLATLVDSDPIDVSVLSGGVDTLYHANPYDNDLLLSSDRNQYRLSYQNFLGPKNLQISFSTAFSMSADVHPINMGSSVYFVDDKDEYNFAKVFEYYPQGSQLGDSADDATGPIPEYIKNGISCLAGSTRLRTVALLSDNAPNSIYIYKYYWNGQSKIQNAWNTWVLPDVVKIHWAGFSFNYLYVIVQRTGGGIFLERFYIDESVSRDKDISRYLIDRQIDETDVTVSYNATTKQSTITLPFAFASSAIEVLSDGADYSDARHAVTKVDNTHLKVDDYDLTAATRIRIGIPYTFSYTFSKPFMRQPTRTGEVVILDSQRLQMKYLTVQTVDTAYFRSRVSYPGRDDIVTPYEGIQIDDPNSVVAGPLGADRRVRIPIMGNNRDLTLTLENDSPWNSQFASAEWTFAFMMRSGKRL